MSTRLLQLAVLESRFGWVVVAIVVAGLPSVVKIDYVEVAMLGPAERSTKHRGQGRQSISIKDKIR